MKTLLGIVKKPWFISVLGLLLVALLVWFIGPYIAIAGRAPRQSRSG